MEIELIQFIYNNGLATGLLIYFFIRIKPALDDNTKALVVINETIRQCPKPKIPN